MNIHIFNACLLIGWIMVTAGAMVLNLGAGACVGGALLIALTFATARMGGLFINKDSE